MDVQLIAAIIDARVAVFNATLAGMLATNALCSRSGQDPTYGEADFLRLIDNSDIHHNALFTFIRDNQ